MEKKFNGTDVPAGSNNDVHSVSHTSSHGWEKNAEKWAEMQGEFGDYNKENVLNKSLFELIGDAKDKKILDAGCGEGYLSRLLYKMGAAVTGIDLSSRLIEIARKRTSSELKIDFQTADIQNLQAFSSASFDIIVSSLVLQDIPNHIAALKEFYRLVKDNGAVIIAVNHPCFSSDGKWHKNSEGDKLFWQCDNYFYETAREQNLFAENPVYYYHRTLTSYFQSFKKCGFLLEEMVEPCPSLLTIAKNPAFLDDLRMTHFIIFKLMK